MTLGWDESAHLAAGGIEREDPFVLSRFGDGDLYCMKADTEEEAAAMLTATLGERPGRPPAALADGEVWTPAMRDSLRNAWAVLTADSDTTLMLGDPRTSDFGRELWPYWDSLASNIIRPFIPIHHEMFWLRAEPQPGLLRLCQALRATGAAKVLVGRAELAPAADIIDADFVEVSPFTSLEDAPDVAALVDHDIVIVCAGRGGKEILVRTLAPDRTIIDAGALFDPLYIGNTRPRRGAASDEDVEAFFTAVADEPITVASNRPGRAYA